MMRGLLRHALLDLAEWLLDRWPIGPVIAAVGARRQDRMRAIIAGSPMGRHLQDGRLSGSPRPGRGGS